MRTACLTPGFLDVLHVNRTLCRFATIAPSIERFPKNDCSQLAASRAAASPIRETDERRRRWDAGLCRVRRAPMTEHHDNHLIHILELAEQNVARDSEYSLSDCHSHQLFPHVTGPLHITVLQYSTPSQYCLIIRLHSTASNFFLSGANSKSCTVPLDIAQEKDRQ